MKVFEGTPKGEWGEKVNFVDENNVFVGYDMGSCCCEHADWFIAPELTKAIPDEDKTPEAGDLEGWVFDPDFCEKVDEIKEDGSDYNSLDEGGMVVFRMVKDGAEKFLHLFNCHNGYYGHGFTMKIGDEIKHDDCL